MLFKKKNKNLTFLADLLYRKIIKQAREKEFYTNFKVPDSVDGRFELILLHFFFIYNNLNNENADELYIIDQIMNIMFKDFDSNLREMGVGDLSVGKKIYKMSEALAGRIKAYGKALKNDTNSIKKVIKRNLYGTVTNIDNSKVLLSTKYFKDSIVQLKKNNLLKINENDDIFLNLKKYLI